MMRMRYLSEILFRTVGFVQTQSHAHSLQDFNVVMNFKSIIEGEEVLHFVTGYRAVNDSFLARIHN